MTSSGASMTHADRPSAPLGGRCAQAVAECGPSGVADPGGEVEALRVTVPAAPDAALWARQWIFERLRDASWPPDVLQDVALAVDEAVQNAVEHGSQPDGDIRVALSVRDDEAVVRVRDRGRPGVRVPSGAPQPPDPRSVRGRGRLIMSTLADVDWCPVPGGGTEVCLHFSAHPADDPEGDAAG